MLARKHLKKIRIYKPGKPIDEVKREMGLRKVYKLASNENPFGPSGKVISAIKKEISNINRYPDANCYYLRKKLAQKLQVKEQNLIFGNGSDEIIVLALRAFVEPGVDEVIVSYPTFLIYEIQAKAQGVKTVNVSSRNLRYDLDAIRKKVTGKTKIIFIANPDNPTGTYINSDQMKNFFKKIPRNIIIFLDEAYSEFAPRNYPKSIDFFKAGCNIIFTRTFSKAYGLAGLRIGYGVAKKELIEAMDKVREPFNVNCLAQSAALAALKETSYTKKVVACIKQEKRFLYNNLDKLGIPYVKSATNFILIKIGKSSSAFQNYLLRKGIIVRDMSAWKLRNYIRVTIGRHAENVEFIKKLKAFLAKA